MLKKRRLTAEALPESERDEPGHQKAAAPFQPNNDLFQPECTRVSDRQVKFDRKTSPITKDRLKYFKVNRMNEMLVNRLRSLIPRKIIPNHTQQQWESHEDIQETTIFSTLWSESSPFVVWSQVGIMVFLVFVAWTDSVRLLFNLSPEFVEVMSGLHLVLQFIELGLELNTRIFVDTYWCNTRMQVFQYYLHHEFCMDLIRFLSIVLTLIPNSQNTTLNVFIILAIIVNIIKIKKKYSSFVRGRLIEGQAFEKIYDLVQLFIFILIIAHFFGIMLYAVALAEFDSTNQNLPQQTWVQSLGLRHASWITQYIYSVYWATTTMGTVGFGDITPTNRYEVIAIMIVQLFGVALFGYVTNTIGSTMSQIKKSAEKVNAELSTLSRLSRCFGLQPDLSFRIKQFIRNSYKVMETYSIAQQQEMASKLPSSLRLCTRPNIIHSAYILTYSLGIEILYETNIKVIKRSLFFIANFTKNFQDMIAVKLVKRILQSGEAMSSSGSANEPSLFIIDQGIVDLYFNMKRSKTKSISKLVKELSINGKDFVGINIYGYSTFIVGKPNKLSATCKGICVCYQLTKPDFVEILNVNPRDYQTYFELRDRMNAEPFIQAVEGPSLNDSQKHYIPNKYLICRKNAQWKIPLTYRRHIVRRNTKHIRRRIMETQKYQQLTVQTTRRRVTVFMDNINVEDQFFSDTCMSGPKKTENTSNIMIRDSAYTKSALNIEMDIMREFEYYKPKQNFSNIRKRYNGYSINELNRVIAQRNKSFGKDTQQSSKKKQVVVLQMSSSSEDCL